MFIQHHLCSRIISPISQCHICQDICPKHSLQLTDNTWQINDCSECGLCAAHCPQQVFQLDYPELLQQADSEKTLALSCVHYPSIPADAVKVRCLQQFSPLQLLTLSEHYQKVIIYMMPEACDSCIHHWYTPLLSLQLEQYHLSTDKIELVSLQTADNDKEQNKRRNFFKEMFRESKTASGNFFTEKLNQLLDPFAMDKKEAASASASALALPPPRQALVNYYKQQKTEPATSLPIRQLECSSCHFCGACTAICPSHALSIHETDEEKTLFYTPALCTQCGLCLDICFDKKLNWADKLTIEQLLNTQTLRQSPAYTCSSCGHTYHSDPPTDNNLCRFCR